MRHVGEKAAARAENKAGRSVGQDSGGESEQAERGSTERLPRGGGMPMKGDDGSKPRSTFPSRGIERTQKKKGKGYSDTARSVIPMVCNRWNAVHELTYES